MAYDGNVKSPAPKFFHFLWRGAKKCAMLYAVCKKSTESEWFSMKKQSARYPLMMLLAAVIWGIAFVSQKEGMAYVGPFTYNGVRSLLGGAVLLPVIPLLDRIRSHSGAFEKGRRRDILLGGLVCGTVLFVASSLQQLGIAAQDETTNVGKAGFITTCYVVIVPIFGMALGKKSPGRVWIAVAVAVAGFFCLSLMDGLLAGEGVALGASDLLVLMCAFVFSVHILCVDHFSPLVDGVRMSCVQFFVCGLWSLPFMLLRESPRMSDILACWLPIGYAGVMSCGVAYTLQVVAQKGVHPAVASLILSLESVFAVLAGYVFMPGSTLTAWEIVGCVLVLGAVLLVQTTPADGTDDETPRTDDTAPQS